VSQYNGKRDDTRNQDGVENTEREAGQDKARERVGSVRRMARRRNPGIIGHGRRKVRPEGTRKPDG
jgi:hypothetical protein